MKRRSTLKIYYSDLLETILSNIILLLIISLIIIFLQLPFFFYIIQYETLFIKYKIKCF